MCEPMMRCLDQGHHVTICLLWLLQATHVEGLNYLVLTSLQTALARTLWPGTGLRAGVKGR